MPTAKTVWEYVFRAGIPILLLAVGMIGASLAGMSARTYDADKRIAVIESEAVQSRELLEALATIRHEITDGNNGLRERIQAIDLRLTRIETMLKGRAIETVVSK